MKCSMPATGQLGLTMFAHDTTAAVRFEREYREMIVAWSEA